MSILKSALRFWRRDPLWSLLSLLCLATATLVTTPLVSAIRELTFSGDPRLADAGRLLTIGLAGKLRRAVTPVSPVLLEIWRQNVRNMDMAAQIPSAISLRTQLPDKSTAEIETGIVTANYLTVLGMKLVAGRTFSSGSGDAANEVVISESLWRRYFGYAPSVLGASLTLNHRLYRIVGVTVGGYPAGAEAWIARLLDLNDILEVALPMTAYVEVWGRLKPGVSERQALSELIAATPGSELRAPTLGDDQVSPVAETIPEAIWRKDRTNILLLLTGVAAVFLIGCANAAAVFLARAQRRERDMALRLLLGARIRDVAGELIGETVSLIVVITVVVMAALPSATRALQLVLPLSIAPVLRTGWDIVPVTLLVAIVCVLVTTGAPFTIVFSRRHARLLRDESHTTVGSRRGMRFRAALLSLQVAVTVVLLAMSLQLMKSAARIAGVNAGIDVQNCIVVKQSLAGAQFATIDAQARYLNQAVERIRHLSGVSRVGSANFLPIDDGRYPVLVERAENRGVPLMADAVAVAGDYFNAAGVRVLRGRLFEHHDTKTSQPVAIIDADLAQRLVHSGDIIGSRIRIEGRDRTIVGICGPTRFRSLSSEASFTIYVPLEQAQIAFPFVNLVIRLDGKRRLAATAINQALSLANPSVSPGTVTSLDAILKNALLPQTLARDATALLGVLGTILSTIGLMATMMYSLACRRREFGVRTALGATRWQLARSFLSQPVAIGAFGLLSGMAMAFVLFRTLQSLMYGVWMPDPVLVAAVSATVVFVVAISSLLPFRLMANVPVAALLREL